MHLFYSEHCNEHQVILIDEEARHCSQVLRHREGDTIQITDGKGNLFECQINRIGKSECTTNVISLIRSSAADARSLHIAVAPTKNNERFEWFLEKATEIGIHEITPIICEHSERRVLKSERMKKVLIASIKQSYRTQLPILNEAVEFDTFINQNFEGMKSIALQKATYPIQKWYQAGQNLLVLIGPEGDFSENEIQQSKDRSFTPIALGKSRLRTETAALVSCQAFNLMNEY